MVSVLDHVHPTNRSFKKVSNFVTFLSELNTNDFDFSTPFECSQVVKLEEKNIY